MTYHHRRSYPEHTVDDAKTFHKRDGKIFITKVENALRARLPHLLERKWRGLLGPEQICLGASPSCHLGVRNFLREGITVPLLEIQRDPNVKFSHITVVHEEWNTGDRRTEVDLVKLKKKTRNAFQKAGFKDFIAVVEVQTYVNVQHEDNGRLMSFHVHAIVFGESSVNFNKMAAKINSLFSVPRYLQSSKETAKAVKASRISGEGDLAYRVHYLFKPPSKVKKLYRSKDGETANSWNASESNERFVMFLRLMEVLSLVDIHDMVFAGGRGVAIRRKVLKEMEEKAGRWPVRRQVGSVNVQQLWRSVQSHQDQERYLPVKIHV